LSVPVRASGTALAAATVLLALVAGCAQEERTATRENAGAAAPDARRVEAAPGRAPRLDEVFPPQPEVKTIPSPFGDRWDPTRPPPAVHETTGPGITSAKLVAAGPADVKKVPRPAGSGPVLYAAVVDVTVAPGSTTDVLGGSSVALASASGQAVPLFAACLPTLQDSSQITAGEGTSIAAWTIVLNEREWICGGGNARMARRVGPGGFKLTGPAPGGWSGPMVLLFEAQAAAPKSLTLAGKVVDLPAGQGE
jgi:hypothetical protein